MSILGQSGPIEVEPGSEHSSLLRMSAAVPVVPPKAQWRQTDAGGFRWRGWLIQPYCTSYESPHTPSFLVYLSDATAEIAEFKDELAAKDFCERTQALRDSLLGTEASFQ